jgi:hypothetical protein
MFGEYGCILNGAGSIAPSGLIARGWLIQGRRGSLRARLPPGYLMSAAPRLDAGRRRRCMMSILRTDGQQLHRRDQLVPFRKEFARAARFASRTAGRGYLMSAAPRLDAEASYIE